jgi:hypothetical protein
VRDVVTCPLCESSALSGPGREGGGRWHLRCGGCGTWRVYDLDDRTMRKARRRLRRTLRRDRGRMVRLLIRTERWGVQVDQRLLARASADAAGRR